MTKNNWDIDKPTQSNLLKADEVAKILNISLGMVYKLMRNNQIPTVRIGNLKRVHPKDLKTYINENRSY
jgi:excisionase family DNA binding protein